MNQVLTFAFLTFFFIFAFYSYRGSITMLSLLWCSLLFPADFFDFNKVNKKESSFRLIMGAVGIMLVAFVVVRWNRNISFEFKTQIQKQNRLSKVLGKSSEGIIILKDKTIEYLNDKFIEQQ